MNMHGVSVCACVCVCVIRNQLAVKEEVCVIWEVEFSVVIFVGCGASWERDFGFS